MKRRKPFTLIMIASTIGIAATAGLSGCTSSNVAPAKGNHTKSSTPTPNPTSVQEISVQSLELPTSLTPQQVGEKLAGNDMTLWNMAGANKKDVDGYWSPDSQFGNDISGYAAPIANANGEIFKQAMFAPSALLDQSTDVPTFVENTIKNNQARLEYYILTAHSKKPYKYWTTVDNVKVLSQDSNSLEIDVTLTEHNNVTPDDQVGSKYGSQELEINGQTSTDNISLAVVDGTYKIANIK